jgi:glycosyltransferase involved in cell wall biosynthesis
MRTNTSVIICIRNVEKHIGKCISSLLDQTFKDFEIVIIDDGCSNSTRRHVQKFKDKRIRYYRNRENIGIAKSRNKGLQLSRGEQVFFTDGDCVVSKDWLEQGLKYLENGNCVGVEGKIYYVSKEYKSTFSDHVCKNEHGGNFMTGNMAYKACVIQSVGGFDEKYDYHEDRDLAYEY